MTDALENIVEEFNPANWDQLKVQPLVAQIGWSHNLIVLQRCKEPLERAFNIRMIRKFGWTKNVLIHQIENQSYEKTLLGQTNFDKTLTPALTAQPDLVVEVQRPHADAGELRVPSPCRPS